MATAAIDTLQTAKAIEEAGLERGPAEAIARAIYQRGADYATRSDIDRLETGIDRLEASTKADIDRLEASTKADIDRLDSKIDGLDAAIRELGGDVGRLFIAVLAASGGIVAALIAGIVSVIVTGQAA